MVDSSEKRTQKNNLEMDAICPICLDFYSDPVFLSCAHIFCLECSKKWVAKKEDLTMTCPMCREEHKRLVKYDRVMRDLVILLKQHGSLLKQHIAPITRLQGLVSKDMALAAETVHSSLKPSNDLKQVCSEKPGHNMVEDPRRVTPSACAQYRPQFFSVSRWDVDVEKGKERDPDICKEPFRKEEHLLHEKKESELILSKKDTTEALAFAR